MTGVSGSTFAGSVTTVTVTTALPHGLSSGANVTISGSGQSAFNGTFSVTVTSPTQFTYTINNVNIAESSDSGKDIIATTDAFASLDTAIGRVTGLFDHLGTSAGTPLESYNYLGTDGIVVRNRPQNQTQLTYVQQPGDTLTSTDGGDQYTGLDRFGRVIDQNWVNSVSGTPTDRFQYWYDRGGNPLYKSIVGLGSTAAGFSELYHASGGADSTGYDNLNRIQSFSRGTLSHSNSANVDPSGRGLPDTSTQSKVQTWTLDQLGNWSSFASTGSTTQSRVFNTRNQITTGTTGLTIPTYNNNGDMTKDQTGITYTYDAWDRMVTSTASGGEVFAYDADGRRPALTICSNTITDSYYSIDWQVLQENSRSTGAVLDQYVWGLGYVDDLVLRDDNSSSGSYGKSGSGLGSHSAIGIRQSEILS